MTEKVQTGIWIIVLEMLYLILKSVVSAEGQEEVMKELDEAVMDMIKDLKMLNTLLRD